MEGGGAAAPAGGRGDAGPMRAAPQPGAALFEACCSDHIQPFDEEDDLWQAEATQRAARVTRARWAERARQGQEGLPWGHCAHCATPLRFGGPRAPESQDGAERAEAHGFAARAGALQASTQKEGPREEGGSQGR